MLDVPYPLATAGDKAKVGPALVHFMVGEQQGGDGVSILSRVGGRL